MRTDDLVSLLAKDVRPVRKHAVPLRLVLFAIIGPVAAFAVLIPWLGIRSDLSEAVFGFTFWMKAGYTAVLAVAGFALAERLARPGGRGGVGLILIALAALVMVMLAGAQLSSTPSGQMGAALLGSTWTQCPWRIVVLSIPGLIALLIGLRRFAPSNPWRAGAAAGLLAGGLGATVYGFHCQESAAPFVAIWYSLGISLSGLVGAIFGSRFLRW